MSLSPEQAQHASNIQSRMLANMQAGKPTHEGIDPEDIRLALASLRSGRATAAAAATAGRKKAKKAAGPEVPMDDLMASMGLEGLDDEEGEVNAPDGTSPDKNSPPATPVAPPAQGEKPAAPVEDIDLSKLGI